MFECENYDDEQTKMSILQERVHNCVSRTIELGDHAYLEAELYRALYEEIMYTIEFYYWEYPLLAMRLHFWIDNAMLTNRNGDECSAVADAIRVQMDAAQMEVLLDELDRH